MAELIDKPGSHIIGAAIEHRDGGLLRVIAVERKGLSTEQRDGLLLAADLIDGCNDRPANVRPAPERDGLLIGLARLCHGDPDPHL